MIRILGGYRLGRGQIANGIPVTGLPLMSNLGVKPGFFLATTSDTEIDPGLVRLAFDNQVNIFRITAHIDDEGNFELSLPELFITEATSIPFGFPSLQTIVTTFDPDSALLNLECPNAPVDPSDPDPEDIGE